MQTRGGIISGKQEQKRKRRPFGDRMKKTNFIYKNSGLLVSSVKYVIFFMKEGLASEKYHEVLNLAKLLSKAHFFKWQNRVTIFKDLKVEVYEIGISACLSLHKYNKSIFFLRFLINKFPENPFYLTLIEKVTRLARGKLTINTFMKKDIEQTHGGNSPIFLYLLGI